MNEAKLRSKREFILSRIVILVISMALVVLVSSILNANTIAGLAGVMGSNAALTYLDYSRNKQLFKKTYR